jgi:acetyl-CoA acetyltransferase
VGVANANIVGIGQTEYRRRGGWGSESELGLAARAILNAANDAGIPPGEIDGLCSFANEMPGEDAYGASLLQVTLGLPALRHASFVWCAGGGGACAALANAVAAVQAGQANVIAVVRSVRQAEDARYGQFNPRRPFFNWGAPAGAFSPVHLFALWMQRHMHEYGTSEQHLATIAINARQNANRNPLALFYNKELTAEQYQRGRMISEPFRIFDCCLESDGAAAVLVTTAERARDMRHPGVAVLAVGQGSDGGWGAGPLGSHNMPQDIYTTGNLRTFANELFARAGVSREAVDVAQIYDAFTGMVLFTLEDFGFCGRGESGSFVSDGHIGFTGGSLPVNTSGGHLSEAYVHGMNLLVEGVRQMRGSSTAQVSEARVCLVASAAGLSPSSAALLGRI